MITSFIQIFSIDPLNKFHARLLIFVACLADTGDMWDKQNLLLFRKNIGPKTDNLAHAYIL